MVLLKSPFDGKKSQLDISGPGTMYKSAGPFPHLTKASNQVENVLEARGLGLQLFFKGLSEKKRGSKDLPRFVFHSVLLSRDGARRGHAVLPAPEAAPVAGMSSLNAITSKRLREFGSKMQVLF